MALTQKIVGLELELNTSVVLLGRKLVDAGPAGNFEKWWKDISYYLPDIKILKTRKFYYSGWKTYGRSQYAKERWKFWIGRGIEKLWWEVGKCGDLLSCSLCVLEHNTKHFLQVRPNFTSLDNTQMLSYFWCIAHITYCFVLSYAVHVMWQNYKLCLLSIV